MQLQADIKISEYSVVPKRISEKELQQKNLLLSLSIFQDEIEAAIIDLTNYSVYAVYGYASYQRKFSPNEYVFIINDFVHRYHLYNITFKMIEIIYSSPHFTFCPTEFFLSEHKRELLQFTHPIDANEIVLTNDFNDIKIIYSIHKNIYQNLLQLFPSARLYHSATAMLHILFYHPVLIHSKLWIHIHPDYIEVIAKNQKQFLFYNTFDTQSSLDVLYYVLFCVEQLELTPKETDVYISGNVSMQHSIIQLLQKYVHTVQFVHHHPKLHILPTDAHLLTQYYFITLNHSLCVSSQENTKAEK